MSSVTTATSVSPYASFPISFKYFSFLLAQLCFIKNIFHSSIFRYREYLGTFKPTYYQHSVLILNPVEYNNALWSRETHMTIKF